MQARIARHVTIITGIALAGMIAVGLVVSNVEQFECFIALIFLAGTAGGIANNFRHVKKVDDRELVEDELRLAIYQVYLSPLIGGVFGVVMYGIFASGLLEGSGFPTFDGTAEFSGAKNFADSLVPLTNGDAAKALVWSFIAGFAEWLVPNFIDGIIQPEEEREEAEE